MDTLKAILKKIFCLPPLPTVILSLFGYIFLILVAGFDVQAVALQHASYLASAYALCITITGFRYLPEAFGRFKGYLAGHFIVRKIRSTRLGEMYLSDVYFRARVSLHAGLTINLVYIAIKLSVGISCRSVWFISLTVYYLLLAVMRFSLVLYADHHQTGNDTYAEFRRYRACGIMLLLMNQALALIVIIIVRQNYGFEYPGNLIYVMALYAFYAVITAVINIVKTRRHQSPVLSAAKAVDLVVAMVAILSLETAMLSQFGGDDPMFRRGMTGSTGGAVCTIVIVMAIYMICRANINLKTKKTKGE